MRASGFRQIGRLHFPQPVHTGKRRRDVVSHSFSGSVEKARQLLNLPSEFSKKELRDSYSIASKKLHPDVNRSIGKEAATKLFLEVTDAYEILQKMLRAAKRHVDAGMDPNDLTARSMQDIVDDDDLMTEAEEAAWR